MTGFPQGPFSDGFRSGLTSVAFVDGVNGDDSVGRFGLTDRPFKTIQAAINAVPEGDTSAKARVVHVIRISPGDYDEDLAINLERRRIILTGPGPWGLGQFNAADWGPSGTPRNITVTGALANIDGIRPGLAIQCEPRFGNAYTTHQSYLACPRISGNIDFSGASAIGSIEFDLAAEVFGNLAGGSAILQSYLNHCRIRGTVIGANWNFQVAHFSRFQGLVNVTGYSLIDRCRIDAGFQSASVPAGILPEGFVNSVFAGNFTGPAAFRLDGFTNRSFKANGGSLLGGAVKVILDDLVP